jgi:hypothetical protein
MKKTVMFSIVLTGLMLLSVDAEAQAKTRVRFPAGTHGTSVKGTCRGYAYHDYLVRVSAGQSINIFLTSSEPSTVFSIVTPEGGDLLEASETTSYSGELITSGDYRVRVLMMRSAARRRGSVSNYTLSISVR